MLLSTLLSILLVSAGATSATPTADTTVSQNETASTEMQVFTPSSEMLPQGLIALSSQGPFAKYAFVVDKTHRTLMIYENTATGLQWVASHPTDIGKNKGPKQKENDQKTPVGIYFLHEQLSPPQIPFSLYGSLAFTTDYPNVFDRREEKTGYGIWLHAVPDSVPLTRGSRGCVVVRDDIIKKLKSYVHLGQTPILIYDQVEFTPKADHQELQGKFMKEFEAWRQAWESHNIDEYIRFYDESFRNDQMNYRQWHRYKRGLTRNYEYIKVQLGTPLVLQNKDQVVLRFTQRYESDKYQDYGEKTIHARWVPGGSFKIIREEWRPLLDDPTAERKLSAESEPVAQPKL